MNQYVTGTIIKSLREKMGMTQQNLAEILNVSDKAISRWETGKGYPDISLLEPLGRALHLSVAELLTGNAIQNHNCSGNILRSRFYVCPVCGNVLWSMGEASIHCCGIELPPLETEEPDDTHRIHIEEIEDEYYVTLDHPMTKEHHISFLVALQDDGYSLCKLYPEGSIQARFKRSRTRMVFAYCNYHGFFGRKV